MSQDHLSRILTQIRNASLARMGHVTLEATKASYALARILKANGYIVDFKVAAPKTSTGANTATKVKFYRQRQQHTLWKIQRKLRVLMRRRQQLKRKLKLSYRRALTYAKRAKRLQWWRSRKRFSKRSWKRKSVHKRTLKASTLPMAEENRVAYPPNQPIAKGKKQSPRKLGRLRPAPKKDSPYAKWIAKSPRFKSKRRRFKRLPYVYMRKQKTKLYRLFRRQRGLKRFRLKQPYLYLRQLRRNGRLCFRLQKKRAELKAYVKKHQSQTQTTGHGIQGKQLHLRLKYFGPYRRPAISQIKRISRPSLRRTSNFRRIGRVHLGMGLTILSTSQGMMSHLQAQRQKVGGEIILTIW